MTWDEFKAEVDKLLELSDQAGDIEIDHIDISDPLPYEEHGCYGCVNVYFHEDGKMSVAG